MAKKKTKPRKPCIVLALVLSLLVVGRAQADTCAVGLMPPFTAAQANKLCSTFVGDETIGASLIPCADNAYDVGDADYSIRSLYLGTSLIFNDVTASDELIKTLSVDGADSNLINITPGGAYSSTRGAGLQLNGNEQGTNPADAYLESGSAATGDVFVRVNSTNGLIRFATNSDVEVWNMNASGALIQNATNGGDVIFQKPGTFVNMVAYVPTMAATPAAGTNMIQPGLNVIPTAAANTAAILGATTPTPGAQYVIYNSGPNSVRVKAGGGATMNGATAGGYAVMATNTSLECYASSAANYECKVPVHPTPAGP